MEAIVGPVIWLLFTVIDLYMWVVIAAVVLSWLTSFNVINTSNRFVYLIGDVVYRMTEPVLGRIRGFIPNLGGIDLSPVVLLLGLVFLKKVVAGFVF
jgi:YggT family protein